jgi:hypothetical protein
MKKIPKKLIICHGFAKGREFRSEALHLGIVLICCHREFLGVIEFSTKMLYFGS